MNSCCRHCGRRTLKNLHVNVCELNVRVMLCKFCLAMVASHWRLAYVHHQRASKEGREVVNALNSFCFARIS